MNLPREIAGLLAKFYKTTKAVKVDSRVTLAHQFCRFQVTYSPGDYDPQPAIWVEPEILGYAGAAKAHVALRVTDKGASVQAGAGPVLSVGKRPDAGLLPGDARDGLRYGVTPETLETGLAQVLKCASESHPHVYLDQGELLATNGHVAQVKPGGWQRCGFAPELSAAVWTDVAQAWQKALVSLRKAGGAWWLNVDEKHIALVWQGTGGTVTIVAPLQRPTLNVEKLRNVLSTTSANGPTMVTIDRDFAYTCLTKFECMAIFENGAVLVWNPQPETYKGLSAYHTGISGLLRGEPLWHGSTLVFRALLPKKAGKGAATMAVEIQGAPMEGISTGGGNLAMGMRMQDLRGVGIAQDDDFEPETGMVLRQAS